MNKRKKKKGFTLIELVIVLAVLAIIALIAIPNFTKVRNDSLVKADKETMNQIEKITLMAIANEDIVASGTINIKGADVASPTGSNVTTDYIEMMREVKKPQSKDTQSFNVEIDADMKVTVTTSAT